MGLRVLLIHPLSLFSEYPPWGLSQRKLQGILYDRSPFLSKRESVNGGISQEHSSVHYPDFDLAVERIN